MARFGLGLRCTNGTNGSVTYECIVANRQARVLEIGISLNTTVASVYGIGRSTSGTGPTSPVDFLADDPNDTIPSGDVQGAVAWSTSPRGFPSAPAAYFRRFGLPNVNGAGFLITLDPSRPIVVPGGQSLCITNATAAATAMDAYMSLDA